MKPQRFVFVEGKPYVRVKAPKMEPRTISTVKANVAVSQIPVGSREPVKEKLQLVGHRSKSAPNTVAERVNTRVRVVRTGKTSGPGKASI